MENASASIIAEIEHRNLLSFIDIYFKRKKLNRGSEDNDYLDINSAVPSTEAISGYLNPSLS